MIQHIKKVIAVIITYRPDLDLLNKNFLALAAQVEKVILVDNSDDPLQGQQIREHFQIYPQLVYINNDGNQGIAHALNRGVKYAEQLGADWVLTMDQDSCLPADYVAILSSVASAQDDSVASIGTPFLSGEKVFTDSHAGGPVKLLITSGNLLQIAAVKQIGYFRDDFFIDYVDFDLSLRLRKAGFQLIETHETSFQHRLGEPQKNSFLGKTFSCSNYSPLRIYYMSRNRMVFFRENFFFDPLLVLRCCRDMMKESIKIVLGEKAKMAKLKAILFGIKDGVVGKMGKYSGTF